MWIVPKTLSHFVPDTEGLNLDLEERAWMLESSAMWRSKPSSKQTWLRRLKKGGWITHLSTRILKPSLHESFEEKYTASLEDIPANPSVAQESEKAKKTQDTYGHISESTSGQLDLFGAFSKMSEVTPRWGYGESCPIWKKMVTERSSDCSQRRKQARLTNASDASSWPTVAASEARQGYQDRSRGKKGSQKSLTTIVVDNWSTPQARDWKGAQGRAYKGEAKDLPAQTEQNWPTPRAGNPGSRKPGTGGKILAEEAKKNWLTPRTGNQGSTQCRGDRKGPNGENIPSSLDSQVPAEEAKIHAGLPAPEKSNTLGKNQGSWPTARSSDAEGGRIKTEKTEKGFRSKREKSDQYFGAKLRDAAEMEKPPTMKLNPNWVEQLMGLEVGWTQLPTAWTDCASSEMALSANVQR